MCTNYEIALNYILFALDYNITRFYLRIVSVVVFKHSLSRNQSVTAVVTFIVYTSDLQRGRCPPPLWVFLILEGALYLRLR